MSIATHDPQRRSRNANSVRLAWADARRRPLPALIALFAAFVPGANLLLVGGAGQALYRAQRERLESALPTEITLLPPPGAGEALRITPALLAELEALPWAARAYPKIELQLRLESPRTPLVPVEGRVPADPAHRGDRLVAGRGFDPSSDLEVVLAQDLFQRLGGRWTQAGPVPGRIAVRAARQVAGVEQEARLELAIVGLVREERRPDLLEVPLGLALDLDHWFGGGRAYGLPEPPQLERSALPELDAQDSWVRATLFARDLDSLEPLVEHVRRNYGYQTRDSLAEQRALRELAHTLTLLVSALVAGTFLIGIVASLGTQAQKTQSHVREIGLLRSMGASSLQVLGIHGVEGLGLGSAALLLALGVQLLAGPPLALWLATTLGLAPLHVGPPTLSLSLAVAAVCIGASLAGTLLPVLWTCWRTSLVSTLRS